MNIGYIGLGALGAELGRRFLPAHRLTVWDLHPAARSAFEGSGAHVARDLAELATRSDVILLCLPRSADVRQALFGEGGLAPALRPGQLVIDQTSGTPGETAALAEELRLRGVAMLDAAVSASPHVVSQGGASLMVSGPVDVVERAMPVLQMIATTLFRCGARVGDGQATKLVNNAVNAAIRLGTLELTALGVKAGVALQALAERLNAGPARNQTTDKMLPALVRGEASTNFGLPLMVKDLNQALELGVQRGVPMPVVALTRGLMQSGLNLRGPSSRLEDMVGVTAALAGTQLVASEPRGEPAAHVLADVETAVAALCAVATLECVAAGLRFGLALEPMRQVLGRASGWSTCGQQQLACLAEGGTPALRLDAMVAALRCVSALAARHGTPGLLSGAVLACAESAVDSEFNIPALPAWAALFPRTSP